MDDPKRRIDLRLAAFCLGHDQRSVWAGTSVRHQVTIGFRDAIDQVVRHLGHQRREPDQGGDSELAVLEALGEALARLSDRIGPKGSYADAALTAEWVEVQTAAGALYRRLRPAHLVESLGVLSRWEISHVFGTRRQELLGLAGAVPPGDRTRLADYMRGGTLIFPFMEWARDIIDDAFSRAGGSGAVSDGQFYWRGDAADYVEHYGIAVPEAFIELARSRAWQAPAMSWEYQLEIDDYLTTKLGDAS